MDKALLNQARRLNARNGGPNCPIPPIVLMTDDQRLPDPEAAIRALPHDSMVIFRHYGLEAADRARLGAKLRTICRARGIIFLVANDVALALKLDADGVHFPEYRVLSNRAVFAQVPQRMIRTSACHSTKVLNQLRASPKSTRPDALFISPVFATKSHPNHGHLEIIQALQMGYVCVASSIQPIALGGITVKNIDQLRFSNFTSIAGISFSGIRG